MPETLYYSTTLTTLTCGVCAIPFAVPSDYLRKLQETGKSFHCPNGCSISYHETDNAKLRKQLERERERATWHADQAEAARRDACLQRRRLGAAKGQLTKIRKRIAEGVCPVPGCKRSGFVNVKLHIAVKHPDYHKHEEN